MRIDAHQHFWHYLPDRDHWIDDSMEILKRDFMPEDYLPMLGRFADGTVAVQADMSTSETKFLLNLADTCEFIRGVVGWVDLTAGDLDDQLQNLSAHPRFCGVRHILQDQPRGYMLRKEFVEGISRLAKYDLSYDVLIRSSQLDEAHQLLRQLPPMRLVVDHLGKPAIVRNEYDRWATWLKKIAAMEHVHVKLSGLATEADWTAWSVADLKPYVECILEQFGPHRIMLGSDWPVCLLAGSYDEVMRGLMQSAKVLSETETEWITGRTAMNFYKLQS